MQKYSIDFSECDPEEGTGCGNGASMWPDSAGEYYLASDVDARIAELEQQLRDAIHDRDTTHAELVHLQNHP